MKRCSAAASALARAEHMRVAPHELLADALRHIGKIK